MEIVLIGYMGSGKSTIAKKLASDLNLRLIDLDDYISDKEQDTISNIFKSKGEIYFRKLENRMLQEIVKNHKNYVFALGGGTPCYANNIDIIKSNTISFYLKASIQTLRERLLLEKNKRPLIATIGDTKLIEFIAKHLFERTPYYDQADHTIQIDSKSIDEIVDEIKLNMQ